MRIKEILISLTIYELILLIPAILYSIISNNLNPPSFGAAFAIMGMVMFCIGVVASSMGIEYIGREPEAALLKCMMPNPNEHDIWPSNDDDRIIGHGLGFISNCILAGAIALIVGLYLMGE